MCKHALLQDAAYASLLKRTRQQAHRRTAEVLATQFPETVAMHPERLAQHYTEAACPAQAVEYWQRAGVQARERSADQEALAHVTRGLEVLQALPETPSRTQQELELQLLLANALLTKGQSATEVRQAFARAQVLCHQVGDTPRLFEVLHGLKLFYPIPSPKFATW